MCITELYKTGSPQFRYNIMDLSFRYPREQCACGSWSGDGPFAGRGDNMVKLRGINVWPEAVGELASAVDGVTTDYFVQAVREGNRDEIACRSSARATRPDSRSSPPPWPSGSPTSSVSPSRCESCGPGELTRSPRSRRCPNPSVSGTSAGEHGEDSEPGGDRRLPVELLPAEPEGDLGRRHRTRQGCRSRCARATTTATPSRPSWSARMDELGIATVLLPTCDIGPTARSIPLDYEHVATHWDEMEKLAADRPGRFAALAVPEPGLGMAAVREVRSRLAEPYVVGMFTSTPTAGTCVSTRADVLPVLRARRRCRRAVRDAGRDVRRADAE